MSSVRPTQRRNRTSSLEVAQAACCKEAAGGPVVADRFQAASERDPGRCRQRKTGVGYSSHRHEHQGYSATPETQSPTEVSWSQSGLEAGMTSCTLGIEAGVWTKSVAASPAAEQALANRARPPRRQRFHDEVIFRGRPPNEEKVLPAGSDRELLAFFRRRGRSEQVVLRSKRQAVSP